MENIRYLIEKAKQGDKEARDTLTIENLGLVHHIVKRFAQRGCDTEELFQIGCIGLMKAIDKFDLKYDVAFSTYAVPMIMGEIRRFLRDDGMLKVSRALKENAWKVKKAERELAAQKGGEATLAELATITGLTEEEIIMAQEADEEVESLSQTIYQSDGNEILLQDRIADEKNEAENLLNQIFVHQILDELPQKEQYLIRLRYFENITQTETAKRMGISQVQVSRMEKKILCKIRQNNIITI